MKVNQPARPAGLRAIGHYHRSVCVVSEPGFIDTENGQIALAIGDFVAFHENQTFISAHATYIGAAEAVQQRIKEIEGARA